MQLDVNAVIYCVCLVSVLLAGYFLVQILFNKRFGGDLFFMCSHVSVGCGLFLYSLQRMGPPVFISVILANVLMVLSGVFLYFGVRRFLQVPDKVWIPILILTTDSICFVFFTYMIDSVRIRSIIVDVTVGILVALAGISLYTKASRSIRGVARFVSVALFVFSAVQIMNVITTILQIKVPEFSSPASYHALAFMALLVFLLVWTYGIILMNHQKLIAERSEAEEHFRQVFELGPDISVLSNLKDAKIVNVNNNFLDQTGYKREDLIGMSTIDIHFWSDTSDRSEVIETIMETGSCEKYQATFLRKDGTPFTAIYSGRLVRLNGIPHLVSLIHDISSRIQLEQEVFNEKELLQTTLLSIGDGVISTDIDGRIVLMNPVAERLTGWSFGVARGKPVEDVFCLVNDITREVCESPIRKALSEETSTGIKEEAILISREGVERAVLDSTAPIRDKSGTVIGVVIVFRDFTEEKKRIENIAYLSYHDQLTGLYNRRFFQEELSRLDTDRSLPLTLVMADINGLKMANDAFGHRLGDDIIRTTAEVLRKEFRQSDIISRIGGDEFVAILPNTDARTAEKIVERIYHEMAGRMVESVVLSVSFGWKTKTSPEESLTDIFKSAEDRMYRKKLSESRSTRNRTLNVILQTLYEKNEYEKKHAERVSGMCARIGEAIGLSVESINELKTIGLLHDIGKIAVDDTLLNSTKRLVGKDRTELERHPEAGYRILNSIEELSQLALSVMSHHENWDGSGYPKGLKGEDIPLYARIVSITESYDEITHDRPYQKAMDKEKALYEITRKAGTRFDKHLVEVFVDCCSQGGI